MDFKFLKTTSAVLSFFIATTASFADDVEAENFATWDRVSAARTSMMQAAVNGKPNAGKPFEGICPIRAAEISAMRCLVHNDTGETVGETMVFLDDMKPEKGVSLLNNCADGTSAEGRIKKYCIVFFDGVTDSEGNIHARDYEIVKGAENIPSLN